MTRTESDARRACTTFAGVEGKVVIVTGGGRGLGLAISKGFAAAGAQVAIVGRSEKTLDEAAEAIRATGGIVSRFTADVSDESSVAAMCDAVVQYHGRIDVLVNNAGINPWYKSAEDTSVAEWRQIIDVNLTGVFLACRAVGQVMLAAGNGAIINISSIAGRVGLAKTTAYAAAKSGVELLTRQLALQGRPRERGCTRLFRDGPDRGSPQPSGSWSPVAARTPLGRFGHPEEIVDACLFLASPGAAYVTGHSLAVDGGWTAC